MQAKSRRFPLHLDLEVNEELKRIETKSYIEKLEKSEKDCFVSPNDIPIRKNGSIGLELGSKLKHNQNFKHKTPDTNRSRTARNCSKTIVGKPVEHVLFSNLDLKNDHFQVRFCDTRSKQQYELSILSGDKTGTYRFSTGVVRLGDMPKDFQRVMGSFYATPFTY